MEESLRLHIIAKKNHEQVATTDSDMKDPPTNLA